MTLLALKTWADRISIRREKNVTASKMYILRKMDQKLKNVLFLHFMTTFHTLALKIETIWGKSAVEFISDTRNANNVCMYVWFSYSRINDFKKM